LSFEQIESMRRLSRQVLTQLELRRKLIEHDQTIKELDRARIEIAAEKARAEELLDNLLPAAIAEELKRYGKVQPKYSRSATILFADFQGFTLLAERTEPAALVGLLDQYFTAFDDIVARYGLEKLKTIGDAYMAVGGVPAAEQGNLQISDDAAAAGEKPIAAQHKGAQQPGTMGGEHVDRRLAALQLPNMHFVLRHVARRSLMARMEGTSSTSFSSVSRG